MPDSSDDESEAKAPLSTMEQMLQMIMENQEKAEERNTLGGLHTRQIGRCQIGPCVVLSAKYHAKISLPTKARSMHKATK